MKKKVFLTLIIVASCVYGYSRYSRFVAKNNKPVIETSRTENKAKEALAFCQKRTTTKISVY